MVREVRRFPLQEAATLPRKFMERVPSGPRVLRLTTESRRNARAQSRRRDPGFNSDGLDLHPERGRVAA